MTRLSRRLTLSGSGVINATAAEIAALAAASGLTPGATYFDAATGIHYDASSANMYVPRSESVSDAEEGTLPNDFPGVLVLADSGADGTNHPALMYLVNSATGPGLDTPDDAQASAWFADPDANAEVVQTLLTGADVDGDEDILNFDVRNVYFAFAGSSSYTLAAANTIVAGQMVRLTWSSALACKTLKVKIGSAYGPNDPVRRYRQIVALAYPAPGA